MDARTFTEKIEAQTSFIKQNIVRNNQRRNLILVIDICDP